MPQKKGLDVIYKHFNIPLSYNVGESELKLRDCSNVYSSQGVLHTRYGISRFTTTALGGEVLSMSYYEKNDSTRHRLVKVGTALYDVDDAGANTTIKTGLTASTKHRAVTINDRHIVSIESDGLFQWDATTFTQLGNAVPAAPVIAIDDGSGDTTLTAGKYVVALTFYDSGVGYETNIGATSNTITLDGTDDGINISSIPTTVGSTFIDTVRIYVKNLTTGSEWLFDQEIALGTTTADIDTWTNSTQIPPTTNAIHPTGGAKFLTEFNAALVTAGNSNYPSDVFISTQFVPQGFDNTASGLYGEGARHNILGDGPITGLARGMYGGDNLQPYLVVFKRNSTNVYSDGGGLTLINENIGGYQDTVFVKNGDVYVMSDMGWYRIKDGRYQVDESGDPLSLGMGDIDDVFKDESFDSALNKAQFANMFSVGYSALDQYITFVSIGANSVRDSAFVYEFETGGFKRYNFPFDVRAAKTMKDASGKEAVFLGDINGHLYTHSINVARTDVNLSNVSTNINAFAQLAWAEAEPLNISCNWRELVLTGINSDNAINVRGWVNYNLRDYQNYSFDMSDTTGGFELDVSRLDQGILGDARGLVRQRGDINRVGWNLLLGFYQSAAGADLGLINAQISFSRNGNFN